MGKPAARKAGASALAKFPAPTMATRGLAEFFPGILGRIARVRFATRGEAFNGASKMVAAANSRSLTGKERRFEMTRFIYSGQMAKSSQSNNNSGKSKKKAGAKVKLISSRSIYRGPAFWVTIDYVQEPGGVKARRDVVHHTGSVVVLAVDDSVSPPRVLLERQYRHAAKSYLWEIPAGRIDAGEKPLPAAKRELLEETGYAANHWKRILYFYASPGFVAETMSVFMATGLRAGKAQPEEDEVIVKRMVALPAAIRMVMKGTIKDSKTISSILWLDRHLRQKNL
jgi:ADP-ribose pyrophosphatase